MCRGSVGPDLAPVSLHVYWIKSGQFDENGRLVRSLGGGSPLSWGKKLTKNILGVYHVGVQVYDMELNFGNYHAPGLRRLGGEASGVVAHHPLMPGPLYAFKEAVALGSTATSHAIVEDLATRAGMSWFQAASYNRINHNCVDFAHHLCALLGVDPPPLWCYRGAATARMLQGACLGGGGLRLGPKSCWSCRGVDVEEVDLAASEECWEETEVPWGCPITEQLCVLPHTPSSKDPRWSDIVPASSTWDSSDSDSGEPL